MRGSTVQGPQPTPKVGRKPAIRVVARDEVAQRSNENLTASDAALEEDGQVASVEKLDGDSLTRTPGGNQAAPDVRGSHGIVVGGGVQNLAGGADAQSGRSKGLLLG